MSNDLIGTMYLLYGSLPLVMETSHKFTISQAGLSFLGALIGCVFGAIPDPPFCRNDDRLMQNAQRDGRGPESDFRLPPTMVGGILAAVGFFIFGWTSYSHVHWVLPIIGTGIFGMGQVKLPPLSPSPLLGLR